MVSRVMTEMEMVRWTKFNQVIHHGDCTYLPQIFKCHKVEHLVYEQNTGPLCEKTFISST